MTSSSLSKPYSRLWSIEAGTAMVVTDLHGDWNAYRRYRDRFTDLHAAGQADYLIFTGDLIHGYDEVPDRSLEIIFDLISLRTEYGQAVIYLCGNHEMPHLYSISLAKGSREFTPPFEAALSQSQRRAEVITLFNSLPFFIRTRAGVALAHAGASPPMVDSKHARQLFSWSHQQLLEWADEVMAQEDLEALRRGYAKLSQGNYDELANYYLSVSDRNHPRYNDLLRGFLASTHPSFGKLLWPALFTRCEHEYGRADYDIFLAAMLQELSADFYPQQALVAGHITTKGGYQLSAKQHLRLAAAHHATPREAGQYLLFDTAQPVSDIRDLLKGLGSVYL
jgi:hypothetical protein